VRDEKNVAMPGTSLISPDYIQHAKRQFISDAQLDRFIDFCSRPLRKSIRVNTLKISAEELSPKFDQYGLKLTPIPWCEQGFWVSLVFSPVSDPVSDPVSAPSLAEQTVSSDAKESNSKQRALRKANLELNVSLGNLLEHLQGLFYIQEASSMLPPIALMQPLPVGKEPLLVLDLAAAPGSKTTQLASLLDNAGLILANEKSASRVKILQANLVRCGVSNTCISQFDGNKLKARLSNLFDYVLLDAPCSGEGTIRKDPHALIEWKLEKVREIAKIQKELILTAYYCLRPGGRLVYSTCTLSKEENHQVAESLVAETDAQIESLGHLFQGAQESVTSEGFLHVLPQTYDSEGFFVAAFSKPIDADSRLGEQQQSSPFQPLTGQIQRRIQDYYSSHFGVDISKLNKTIRQRDKEIWLFPALFEKISQRVRLNRSGIKLAEVYPNKIRSTHEFAIGLDRSIRQQRICLSYPQTEAFFKGRDLVLAETDFSRLKEGEVILTVNGRAIGIGRLRWGKIKNQLPRDRVLDHISF